MPRTLTKLYYNFHDKYIHKWKLRFVTWFDKKSPGKYCWADCVGYAFSPSRFNPFKIEPSKGCKTESITGDHKICYCGQWQEGKCWYKLTKQEQKLLRPEQLTDNKIPF